MTVLRFTGDSTVTQLKFATLNTGYPNAPTVMQHRNTAIAKIIRLSTSCSATAEAFYNNAQCVEADAIGLEDDRYTSDLATRSAKPEGVYS